MIAEHDAGMRNTRGGRPSKGQRVQIATRPLVPLAEAARARAESLGMTMSDYLAMLIAQDTELPQFAPCQTDPTRDRVPARCVGQ